VEITGDQTYALSPSMEEEQEHIYTKDGTTDFRNKPAIKKETGTWKACPYILGTPLSKNTPNIFRRSVKRHK
jgi:hypothetical protein